MRLYRNVIILVAVLAVLIGAYFLLGTRFSTKADDTGKIELVKLDKEKVQELTVETGEGRFVFKKNGTEWELASEKKFNFDNVQIDSIASNITDLFAQRVIEEDAKDLNKYGLDKPVSISVKISDGTTASVEIGDETPTKQGYYIKKKDDSIVYTIDHFVGTTLKTSKNDLKSRYLLEGTSADVTEFALNKYGKVVFRVKKLADKGWALTEPIETNINMVRLNTALESVVRASVTNFIEEDAKDLSKYGLDKPLYVFEAATANERVKVLMGAEKEKNSETYAIVEGTSEVFTINPNSLGFLDMPLIEMIEGLVYAPNIDDVTDVEVNIDQKVIKLKMEKVKDDTAEGDKTKDKFYINGKDVMEKGKEGESEFRAYYRSLISISASEIQPEAVPSGTSEISITYHLNRAPGKVTIGFIPKDDKTYYAMKNGEFTGMIVKKDAFDASEGPRKAYDKLMQLLEKKD